MPAGDAMPAVNNTPAGDGVPSGRTPPAGDVVDVWWFDTRAVTIGPADAADLDRGERARAEAFLFPADRHRHQVAHTMLRRVLAGYTGTAPAGLLLGRGPCPHCGAAGKPVLLPVSGPPPAGAAPPGSPGPAMVPAFSLAHSGDMVVIAVAGRPVGVDVEADAVGCVCPLAQMLHPADAARMAGLDERERHAAIITCWVLAEAVLKSTGQCIRHGLDGFPVRPRQAAELSVNGCTVRQLAAPPGYRAAVALAGARAPTPRTVAAPAPAGVVA
jgi:4'-phosphopantetheinyl transferase